MVVTQKRCVLISSQGVKYKNWARWRQHYMACLHYANLVFWLEKVAKKVNLEKKWFWRKLPAWSWHWGLNSGHNLIAKCRQTGVRCLNFCCSQAITTVSSFYGGSRCFLRHLKIFHQSFAVSPWAHGSPIGHMPYLPIPSNCLELYTMSPKHFFFRKHTNTCLSLNILEGQTPRSCVDT